MIPDLTTCRRIVKGKTCKADAVTFNFLVFDNAVWEVAVCDRHRDGLPQLLDVRPELAGFGHGFVHALGRWAA